MAVGSAAAAARRRDKTVLLSTSPTWLAPSCARLIVAGRIATCARNTTDNGTYLFDILLANLD